MKIIDKESNCINEKMKMKKSNIKKIIVIMLAIVLAAGMMNMVFAETAKPSVNFTSSGAIFNKESKLLRFNLMITCPASEEIEVMYSIDNGKAKKLGDYQSKYENIIAHVYLDDAEINGSVISIYAVDTNGNKSDKISTEFQIASSPGITIADGAVPLSVKEGTWSLINLFLAALSIAMLAISLMIFVENRVISGFKKSHKINSIFIAMITLVMAAGNVIVLLTTQNLKHEMVMVDNMTIVMLIVTILSVISTMTLAVRAFGVNNEKKMIRE